MLISIPKKERVGRPLIKLTMQERGTSPTPGSPAGQPGWGGAVREGSGLVDFELKHRMTPRPTHVIAFSRRPAANDPSPRISISLNRHYDHPHLMAPAPP